MRRVFSVVLVGVFFTVRTGAQPSQNGEQRGVAQELNDQRDFPGGLTAPGKSIEVLVRGETMAERRLQSAESVKVVETKSAQHQAADLGEVLARTQGIGVQRSGGLGSGTRFSLNGLTDDQVRFFLNGLPLELTGYPFGIANVPVNLVERVEVYSGVVPIRFGADALGGAVNLVTQQGRRGTQANASYEVGSFASHRVTVGARHLDVASNVYLQADAFLDRSLNRYDIDVDATNAKGKLYSARVSRFHDRYRATGIGTEVGVLNVPWARRLALRGFASEFHREYQNNFSMTVPYGGVSFEERSYGANLSYAQNYGEEFLLGAVVGSSHSRGHLLDVDPCIYDWFGKCLFEGRRGGETDSVPHDALNWEDASFARLNLQLLFGYDHTLRISVAPTLMSRTGEERRLTNSEVRDPLTARRELFTLVNGVEYEANLFGDSLQNLFFLKHYVQSLHGEDPFEPTGQQNVAPTFRLHKRQSQRLGAGNSLRYRFNDWLTGKAAYEWATRLPRPDEVFGDSALVLANLELEPESSHNLNLGALCHWPRTHGDEFRVTVNLFLRKAGRLILLLPATARGEVDGDTNQRYNNVYGARSQGVEASAHWASMQQYLTLDTNFTYQDFRNDSSSGAFGDFDGDRIPNRPYLFANGSARFQLTQLLAPRDELSLTWHSRYVKEFFRGWESAGIREFKQVTPSQLVHSLSLVYFLKGQALTSSSSVEVQNLSNARVYDFFGAQRPGRAVFLKSTVEY